MKAQQSHQLTLRLKVYKHWCSGALCMAMPSVHAEGTCLRRGRNLACGGFAQSYTWRKGCLSLLTQVLSVHWTVFSWHSVCAQVILFSNSFTQQAIPLPKLHKHIYLILEIRGGLQKQHNKSLHFWEQWSHHTKRSPKHKDAGQVFKISFSSNWPYLKYTHTQ